MKVGKSELYFASALVLLAGVIFLKSVRAAKFRVHSSR